jgi:tagatose-1,6-bisphosphate aldolase
VSLSDLSDADGRFCVVAIDHRDSLRQFLAPDDIDSISDSAIIQLKVDLVGGLAGLATGVMLEPEFSIPQVPDAGVLPQGVGFTAALESQGYLSDPGAGPTTIVDGWSVAAAAASGAAAAKLLLPYHPDLPLAAAQRSVAAQVLSDCRTTGIPLVLEPLFYDLQDPADRPRVVFQTVAAFAALGPDLLKLPFPVDPTHDRTPASWLAACRRVSQLSPMPWVLLSGGGTFESYAAQLETALDGGCSGAMVGRALWAEAARAEPSERSAVVAGTVLPRLVELRKLTASA